MKNGFFISLLMLFFSQAISADSFALDPRDCPPQNFLKRMFTPKEPPPFDPAVFFAERERALTEKGISHLSASAAEFKDWAKRSLPKNGKMTEAAARDALIDLEFLLHDSSLNVKTLRKYGSDKLTRKWIESQYLARVSSEGLVDALKRYGSIRRENILESAYRVLNTNASRAGVAGGLDFVILNGADGPVKYFMVQLPNLKLVKIAEKDMALMLTDGIAPHLDRLVKELKGGVTTQAVYDGVKNSLNWVSRRALLATLAYRTGDVVVQMVKEKIQERQDDAKRDQAIENEFGPPIKN